MRMRKDMHAAQDMQSGASVMHRYMQSVGATMQGELRAGRDARISSLVPVGNTRISSLVPVGVCLVSGGRGVRRKRNWVGLVVWVVGL